MKKMSALALALVLVMGVAGCGSSAAKDQLAAVNEMTSILDGIKDDKSAGEALPKLEKAADRAREVNEKIASGQMKLSEADAMKHMKDLLEAQTKMQAAAMKACAAAKGKSKEITAALGKAQPKMAR